nr:receptor-like protein EIX2 isoform X1 [Setaria viridis]
MAAVRFLLLQGTVLTWLLLILPMPSSSSLQAKRSNGRCITSERDALLSLKAGLSDPGGQLSSWQGEDCCQWKGVHCSNRTSHVVKLDLHGSYELGGEMSSSLVGLQHLKYLDLSCNNFDGSSIPKFIGSLKSLEYLNLSKAAFGGRVPPQLETTSVLTKGQQLELSKGIQYMVNIDLSCNNLTGQIPQGISALVALKSLNVSWNHLSGRIPNNIGDLKALESLDLSHNELSGEIPSSISALTSLASFNLSYNNLSRTIPTGNQLQTLATDDPESMYVGNIGLCGPPLPKGCPGNGTSNFPVDEPEQKDNGMVNSIYLSMIIGFIFGLWVVFCIMLLYKGLRYSYFASIDYLYHTMCVHVVVTWNFLVRR